jgi:hypothetical protein
MIEPQGEAISVETSGKVLVLPTGNAAVLPRFNESTLDPKRNNDNFGGYNGSVDYAPGSIHVTTGTGIVLTDVAGNNSGSDLAAGLLKSLNYLTVDIAAHTITEEFIIANTSTSNTPTVIDACDATTGWSVVSGTGTISVENGRLKIVGTSDASTGLFQITKTVSVNASSHFFIGISIESTVAGSARTRITSTAGNKLWQDATRFAIPANSNSRFNYPLDAPQGTTGQLPSAVAAPFSKAAITVITTGVLITPNTACTFFVDNITADIPKIAFVELQTPNNLADTSLQLYTHNGSVYQLCRVSKLDSTWSDVSTTPANCTLADGTKFDDVYGNNNGRAVFPKGVSGQTVTGSSGTMQYSANKGTLNRIGFMIQLPPLNSNGNFSKIRIKLILTYKVGIDGKYSATFEFADSTSASYGLQNLVKTWIAIYDPASNYLDFYLFTHRPPKLVYKIDESGNVYELILYPGNGLIYWGRVTYPNLILDSDSNLIPNVLDANSNGSVTKFLEAYSFAT